MSDLILLSLANSAIAFGAMYLTAKQAAAITASILVGAQPLMLAIAGRVLFGDRLGRLAGASLALGLAGVTLVATTTSGVTTGVGVALALITAAAPMAGTIQMRRLLHRVDLARTTAMQFLLGG